MFKLSPALPLPLFYLYSWALPPCSLLYRGEGQVKYCRATRSVLSFHSVLPLFIFQTTNTVICIYVTYPYENPRLTGMYMHCIAITCFSFGRLVNTTSAATIADNERYGNWFVHH